MGVTGILLLLSDNQLTHLPESIGFLSILSDLDLSSNQLTFLPESFCNLNIDSLLQMVVIYELFLF